MGRSCKAKDAEIAIVSATDEETQFNSNSSQGLDLTDFADSLNRGSDSGGSAVVRKIDPLLGTILDNRYQIIEVLGEGGMSVVYKARQNIVDRFVAVKTLKIQLQTRPVIIERFKREIKSLCKLSHPNIVTVYDIILDQDMQPYVVMDYLTGKSLEEYITRNGPLPPGDARGVLLQIASAVEHAHKNGIVHRDLKPGNAMLIDDTLEYIKVVDFGLAHLGEDNRKLTNSGEVWGSPPYMSPEQCKGEPCDLRADIYSFGAMMYEILTGKDPFYGASLYELLHKHVKEVPPSMRTANPDVSVPGEIEAIAFKCMEKDPSHRYQSMGELKEALNKAFAATPSTEVTTATKPMHKYQEKAGKGLREASLEPRQSKSRWIIVIAAVAIIAVGAMAMIQWGSNTKKGQSQGQEGEGAATSATSETSARATESQSGTTAATPTGQTTSPAPVKQPVTTAPSATPKSSASRPRAAGQHLQRAVHHTTAAAPHPTRSSARKETSATPAPRKVSVSSGRQEEPRAASSSSSKGDAWAKLRQSRKRDW